jgi:hypothetical protein
VPLLELLEQDHLIGVLAREAVGAEHRNDIDGRILYRITQPIEARPVEAGTAVALIDEAMGGQKLMPLCPDPLLQERHLTGNRLLAPLAFG